MGEIQHVYYCTYIEMDFKSRNGHLGKRALWWGSEVRGGTKSCDGCPAQFLRLCQKATPHRDSGVNMEVGENVPLSERNPCATRLLASSAVFRIGGREGGCWTQLRGGR